MMKWYPETGSTFVEKFRGTSKGSVLEGSSRFMKYYAIWPDGIYAGNERGAIYIYIATFTIKLNQNVGKYTTHA